MARPAGRRATRLPRRLVGVRRPCASRMPARFDHGRCRGSLRRGLQEVSSGPRFATIKIAAPIWRALLLQPGTQLHPDPDPGQPWVWCRFSFSPTSFPVRRSKILTFGKVSAYHSMITLRMTKRPAASIDPGCGERCFCPPWLRRGTTTQYRGGGLHFRGPAVQALPEQSSPMRRSLRKNAPRCRRCPVAGLDPSTTTRLLIREWSPFTKFSDAPIIRKPRRLGSGHQPPRRRRFALTDLEKYRNLIGPIFTASPGAGSGGMRCITGRTASR